MKRTTPRGGTSVALGVAILVITAALRISVGTSLRASPIVSQPVLSDLAFARAAEQLKDPTASPTLGQGSPLYPLLLNLAPRGSEGWNPLVAQAVVEGLTALLLSLWVRRRFGRGAALAAAALYAIDPVGAVFAARVSPVSLATFLFMLAVWLLDRPGERTKGSPANDLGAGLALGVGTLLTPLPFVPLGLLAARRRIAARAGAPALLRLLVPFLALPLAVAAWNASLPGGAFALSWGSGVTLSRAFDPESGGTPRLLHAPSWRDETALRTEAWEGLGREGTPGDLLRFHMTRGAQRLLEHPVASLGVALGKGAASLGAALVPDALAPGFLLGRYGGPMAPGRWSFAALLALAAAGAVAARGALRGSHLLTGLTAVLVAGIVGTASAAARQPAVPLLAALGGVGLLAIAAKRPSLPAAGIALLAAAGSLGLGALAPSAALQNPAEDLRLEATALSSRTLPREARSRLEEARKADPKNLEVRAALGQRYLHEGLLEAARNELEGAYRADSTHATTLMALAKLEQSVNDLPAAAGYLARAATLRPNHPLHLNELGQVLVRMGRVEEARALFLRALALKPDYEVARTNLEAIEAYRQRLESSLYPPEMRLSEEDPLNVAAPEIMASMDGADWQRADSLLTWAAHLHPEHVLPHWLRAAYWARRQDNEGARRELEVCQRLAPGRPQVVQLLAGIYLESGNRAAAERLLAESITHASQDPDRKAQLEAILAALRAPDASR